MTENTKRKTLILLGLIIPITMIIASNLPRLEFQAGMPFPVLQHGQLAAPAVGEVGFVSLSATKFILVLMALILAMATLYSMYQILRGADWKLLVDFLRYGLVVSAGICCLVFLVMLFSGSDSYTTPQVFPTSTPDLVVTSPLGTTPPLLLWLVGIGLFVIGVVVMMWAFTPSRHTSPIGLVGQEAEKARQAIHDGASLKDVILNCYFQMSLALKQEKGIERKEYMTTGEFEAVLEAAGIPGEPIHQLTRLFDAVRYGSWQPNAVDEQVAVRCLEAIMVHSRQVKGKN